MEDKRQIKLTFKEGEEIVIDEDCKDLMFIELKDTKGAWVSIIIAKSAFIDQTKRWLNASTEGSSKPSKFPL